MISRLRVQKSAVGVFYPCPLSESNNSHNTNALSGLNTPQAIILTLAVAHAGEIWPLRVGTREEQVMNPAGCVEVLDLSTAGVSRGG